MKKLSKCRDRIKSRFVSNYRERRNSNVSVNKVGDKRSFKSNECEISDTDSDDFSKLVDIVSRKKCKSMTAFSSSDSDTDLVSDNKEKSVENISGSCVGSEGTSDEESNFNVGEQEDENEVRNIGIIYI